MESYVQHALYYSALKCFYSHHHPKRGGSKSSAQTLNKAKYVFEFYQLFW